MKRTIAQASVLMLLLVSIWGCRSTNNLTIHSIDSFAPYKGSIEEFATAFDSISTAFESPCYTGKTRISMRTPNDSQNGNARFIICEDEAYYRLKNPLGIEAVRIWQKPDSLILWDLIQKEVHIYQHEKVLSSKLEAFSAVNFKELLHPKMDTLPYDIVEDSLYYLLNFSSGEGWLVAKEDTSLRTIYNPKKETLADQIQLQNYRTIGNRKFPTRINILNSTEQTNIFLQLQALKGSNKEIPIEINLPSGVRIYK